MANLRNCWRLRTFKRSTTGDALRQFIHQALSVRKIATLSRHETNFSHSRFDDIFLGIVAHKVKIEPLHSEEFYFYKKTYKGPSSYRYVMATHGYDDSDEMLRVWSEVRANGYA